MTLDTAEINNFTHQAIRLDKELFYCKALILNEAVGKNGVWILSKMLKTVYNFLLHCAVVQLAANVN